jgi:TonB family protein
MKQWRDSVGVGLMLIAVTAVACDSAGNSSESAAQTLKVPGPVIRRMALASPIPRYPDSSLVNRTEGLVAAAIAVNAQGRITSIEILEAPDSAMGRSAREALWRWRFRISSEMSKRRTRITSRVVFYFVLDHGRGMVLNPKDAAALKGRGTG